MKRGTRFVTALVVAGLTFGTLVMTVGEGKWHPKQHRWHWAQYDGDYDHCKQHQHDEPAQSSEESRY